MKFGSPWRWPLYVVAVAIVRRLLRLVRIPEEKFIRRIVTSQNQRVFRYLRKHPPRSVLLIMPRCLKRKGCPVDVRGSMTACQSCDCDGCPLSNVAHLTASYGVHALVAFRSHIAFDMARRERPDLIVATACDDRLVKALRSVPEIPALLTPLAGMERQCINAVIDLTWVEDQIRLACAANVPAGETAATAKAPATPRGGKTAEAAESM